MTDTTLAPDDGAIIAPKIVPDPDLMKADGREALRRLNGDQTYEDWRAVGEVLLLITEETLADLGLTEWDEKKRKLALEFTRRFQEWELGAGSNHKPLEKNKRTALRRLMTDDALHGWYQALPERRQLNHPIAIISRHKKAHPDPNKPTTRRRASDLLSPALTAKNKTISDLQSQLAFIEEANPTELAATLRSKRDAEFIERLVTALSDKPEPPPVEPPPDEPRAPSKKKPDDAASRPEALVMPLSPEREGYVDKWRKDNNGYPDPEDADYKRDQEAFVREWDAYVAAKLAPLKLTGPTPKSDDYANFAEYIKIEKRWEADNAEHLAGEKALDEQLEREQFPKRFAEEQAEEAKWAEQTAKRRKKKANNPERTLADARRNEQRGMMEDEKAEARTDCHDNGDRWANVKDQWEADWIDDNWTAETEADFLADFKAHWLKDHGSEFQHKEATND